MLPTKFQVNRPLGSGEEAKIDFQDGHHGSHLGFLIGRILAIFDVQVILMLPTISSELAFWFRRRSKK